MKVQVEPFQLKSKSAAMRLIRDELQTNMEQIEALVLSVSGTWQGDAERAYASQILYIKKEFANVISFFNDYTTLIDSFADQYDANDRDLAAKINLA